MAITQDSWTTDIARHDDRQKPRRKTPTKQLIVVAITALSLLVGVVLSAGLGQLPIGPAQVVGSVLQMVGIDNAAVPDERLIEQTLWQIRFPRVAMSLCVGAA